MHQELKNTYHFFNGLINKNKLKELIYNAFLNYGIVKSSIIADTIKNLTFHYATKSGISLSIEDLRVPYKKRELIGLTSDEVTLTKMSYDIGTITEIENFQKTIDIWNNTNNFLKEEILIYFRDSDPLNPLYIMAFSGARGNISQVRQLIGMRGLMADPEGQIINIPIKSNFREGLNVTEYIISSYGARKGLVDTALRTADSGYLTRRLVDVAQDIIVREEDCQTKDGLRREEFRSNTNINIKERLVGRLLAEPLYDKFNKEIAGINQELLPPIIDTIESLEADFTVRSPLSCESIRSVCRNCYGWHLSYSKIVDLGEAVGIIAAQSIGEPGTQLTMRTFHTGGVFAGDITHQIRAPFRGIVEYTSDVKAICFRTLHGKRGFRFNKDIILVLKDLNRTRCLLNLQKGSILLVNNGQKVYNGEIIAEVTKTTNLIFEEDKKDIFAEEAGEVFMQGLDFTTQIDKRGSVHKITNNAGLIWVLRGKLYAVAKTAQLHTNIGSVLTKNTIVTTQQILNAFPGLLSLYPTLNNPVISSILVYSLLVKNTQIKRISQNRYLLIFEGAETSNKLFLEVPLDKPLHFNEVFAILVDNSYTVKTGGFITYSLELSQKGKKRKNSRKLFTGSLYWIPEEFYNLNIFPRQNLKVTNGSFIKPGTEILPDIFSKNGGFVQIDDISQELIIKPGELFKINASIVDQTNRFIKPGEFLINEKIVSQRLCFAEFIKIRECDYMLVRPVKTYTIPRERSFSFKHCFFPKPSNQHIRIKAIKKVFLKNWEKIKSHDNENLLQTSLKLTIKKQVPTLQPKIEFVPISSAHQIYKLKISVYEHINNETVPANYSNDVTNVSIRPLVKEKQYVYANTVLANIETYAKSSSILGALTKTKDKKTNILILGNSDIEKINYNGQTEQLLVKLGDLVRAGTFLATRTRSPYSGQIYKIENQQILIRLGKPYLVSEKTILCVDSNAFIPQWGLLARLVYEKIKTTDIVQGLPKVEEILEARKIEHKCVLAPCFGLAYLRSNVIQIYENGNKTTPVSLIIDSDKKIKFINGEYVELGQPLTDGSISPHAKLNVFFLYYKKKFHINEACKLAFRKLQLFLVNEIQTTYSSQGVQIADKHVEIIVKQMTQHVCIEEGGYTKLLPGEMINFHHANTITKAALSTNEEPPQYFPVLRGITKASLNSDSFISAASFQETTRVLTDAAIEGKKDWLNGLKENVIIGRLIPAGTGFNYVENQEMVKRETKAIESLMQKEIACIKDVILDSRLNNFE